MSGKNRHLNHNEDFMICPKLLMIDDEEAFTAAMEKRLAHQDMTVVAAYGGEEGLRKLNGQDGKYQNQKGVTSLLLIYGGNRTSSANLPPPMPSSTGSHITRTR
jgi:hypothetical protein